MSGSAICATRAVLCVVTMPSPCHSLGVHWSGEASPRTIRTR
jgi:hypothetical protein